MKDSVLGIVIIIGIIILGLASSGKVFNKKADDQKDSEKTTVKAGGGLFAPKKSSSGTSTPKPVTAKSLESQIKEIREQIAAEKASVYEGSVTMSVKNPGEQEEYVVLSARGSITTPITITGWKIKSTVTGRTLSIGTASPLIGFSNANQAVTLKKGERALVYSEEKPHYSFRTNKCTGYLEQERDYIPTLEKKCPLADSLVSPSSPLYDQDTCMDYLGTIPRCTEPDEDEVHDEVNDQCEHFIDQNVNYDGCVNMFKNEPDFFGKEWRIYPTSRRVNWREENDELELLDVNGKVVDSVSY